MKDLSSNKEWKKWGEIDPLFGVATWQNREKDGFNPWTDEDFYKLGESDWKDFIKHWERYGVSRENCLEIGCGAGRITAQLASYFSEVHAVDVSEGMIDYAKKQPLCSKVNFYLSNGILIPLADNSVCSVFTTHVFQHFDSLDVAERYFAEIARTMKAGGTLMVHLPLYRFPTNSMLYKSILEIQKSVADMRAVVKRRLLGFVTSKPLMRSLAYPIGYFYDVLPKYGFDDIEISIFVTKSNNDPHPFVFARKRTQK